MFFLNGHVFCLYFNKNQISVKCQKKVGYPFAHINVFEALQEHRI